jgi:hypothetical protein
LLQALQERPVACLRLRIVCGKGVEHADPPHPLAQLRPRDEGPCRSAAEPSDEMAPFCMTRKEHCQG